MPSRSSLALVLAGALLPVSGWGQAPTKDTAAPQAATPRAVPPPLPGSGPPPLPSETTTFFVENQGRPEGPFTLEQITRSVAAGQIGRTTLVWVSGAPAWQRAEDVTELRQALAAAPPPVPQERQFERFITGTWEVRTQQAGMSLLTTIRYMGDGTYSGVQQGQAIGFSAPPFSIPLSGTWRAQSIADRRLVLTLTPREGSGGSSTLTIMDENTIRNEDAGVLARRVNR